MRQLDQTMRWRSMDSGIRASSPWRCSQSRKAASAPADPQNSPMTVALFQLYLVPPHSMASRNMMAAAAKMENPGISKDRRIAGAPVLSSDLGRRSGIWMKKRARMTRPPAGKLM